MCSVKVFVPVLLGLNYEMQKHHLASEGYKAPLQVSVQLLCPFAGIICKNMNFCSTQERVWAIQENIHTLTFW